MAEMNVQDKGHDKGGKPKTKKVSTRIDFTPMVDLGFLLITFFMLTTTLIKPQTMEISMPSKEKSDNTPEVKASRAITIMLGKNDALYYYLGAPKDGKDPEVIKTNYSPTGIRKFLLERNSHVMDEIRELKKQNELHQISDSVYKKKAIAARADKNAPFISIKATDQATYGNVVDILDEMQICNVGFYAIIDLNAYDTLQLKKAGEF